MSNDTDTDSEVAGAALSGPAPLEPGGHVRYVAVLVAIGTLFLVAAATFAVLRDSGDPATADPGDGWGGELLDEPVERPDFVLTDTAGQRFDFRAETEGQLTLLFFGFAGCTDACPIQMQVLSDALSRPNMPQPQVVVVTTDPARDTPERMRSFLDRYGTSFIGLTGSLEEIAAAERAAGVAPSARPGDPGMPPATSGGDYDVNHASQVIAFTPDDLAHVVYPQGVRLQDWVNDLPRLLRAFPAGPDAGSSGAGAREGAAR